ncbi:uncharacterized protein L969DRAFT_96118 [Mixia osmundae IAM 14324]|uniref:uncharacterized protein n=1 Tax=Mixia osmundae (strain CBS 9802 / IAM 14324 / JCM 22182 / KY 12970) TaxID=764103 RepID=UPI0004A548D1|nr:uncharacterized protein L969DRAFT_96118 [Mixia osmundae IAM 14324]KEI37590.1 hypothetical protein L969DRAFT_96118 [Mixia osmundae IAM 14324]
MTTAGLLDIDMTDVQQQSTTLLSLPPEIVGLIGFFAGQAAHFTPPTDLLNLMLVSSDLFTCLSPKHNPGLYSDLFRDRFDSAALKRRTHLPLKLISLDSDHEQLSEDRAKIQARQVAAEYQHRVRILRNMRRNTLKYPEEIHDLARNGGSGTHTPARGILLDEEELAQELWTAYLMLLENDGKNIEQLRRAGQIRIYLNIYYRSKMLNAAVLPGYSLETADRSLALHLMYMLTTNEDLENEDQDRADERFFVLKPYVFAAHIFDSAHASWVERILPARPGLSSKEIDAWFLEPKAPHVQRLSCVTHYGRQVYLANPVLSSAACLSFFMRVERDPEFSTLGQMPMNAEAFAGFGQRQPLLGGVRPIASDRAPKTPLAPLESAAHDLDYQRLLSCYHPLVSPGLTVSQILSTASGSWEGRFSYFDYDAYRDMLAGEMLSLFEGPFGFQPQVWTLQEIAVELLGDDIDYGGKGSVLNAGLTPADEQWLGSLAPPGSPSGFHKPLTRTQPHITPARIPPYYRMLDDNEPLLPNKRYEVLLSGSGHSAWGQFTLQGRIRTWDGHFSLVKKYTPDARGAWLYRGQSLGKDCLVGRWRDTFTRVDQVGYEARLFFLSLSNSISQQTKMASVANEKMTTRSTKEQTSDDPKQDSVGTSSTANDPDQPSSSVTDRTDSADSGAGESGGKRSERERRGVRAPATWIHKPKNFWTKILALDICPDSAYDKRFGPDRGPVPHHSIRLENAFILFWGLFPQVVQWISYTLYPEYQWPVKVAYPFYLLSFVGFSHTLLGRLHYYMEKYGVFDEDVRGRDTVDDKHADHIGKSIFAYILLRGLGPFLYAYDKTEMPLSGLSMWSLPKIAIAGVVLDYFFYVYHRSCHQSDAIWFIHRFHHSTKHPTAILSIQAEEYQELLEVIIIPTLTQIAVPMTFSELWVAITYLLYVEALGHSGIRADWSHPLTTPFLRPFNMELAVEDHDLHHRYGKSGLSYGKQSRVFDTLFNTKAPRETTQDFGRWFKS